MAKMMKVSFTYIHSVLILLIVLFVIGLHDCLCHALIQQQQRLRQSTSLQYCSSERQYHHLSSVSSRKVKTPLPITIKTAISMVSNKSQGRNLVKPTFMKSRTIVTKVYSTVSSSSVSTNDKDSVSFTDEEMEIIKSLAKQCQEAKNDPEGLRNIVMNSLTTSTISSTLIMKLRSASSSTTTTIDDDTTGIIQFVVQCLNTVQQNEYDIAKQTLVELLDAGELRKLDNLIGTAARSGKLDLPFFNVLQANIRDATTSEAETITIPTTDDDSVGNQPPTADRLSILKHIYTRCQEEVEKTIPPGTALLNKLLRTEQSSIRTNLYKHYLLVPDDESNTVTTPDGKTIQLNQRTSALISITDFVQALCDSIIQIRTLEKSNAISTISSAQMVESCRTIAKEARIVISNRYGPESTELIDYQNSLQPVFRPTSSNSPYIQGTATN